MNTRSFIKSLLVASVAPQVLLHAATQSIKWKRSAKSGIYVMNPAWRDAPYELCSHYLDGKRLHPVIFGRSPAWVTMRAKIPDGYYLQDFMPIRFSLDLQPIHPMICLDDVK